MYQFKSIGDDEENPKQQYSTEPKDKLVMFNPRELTNLELVDELQNLASINDMKIDDLVGEGNPQMYMACGRGAYSTLRILRHGLTVIEIGTSQIPGKPIGVMTLKERNSDPFDKYMLVSF